VRESDDLFSPLLLSCALDLLPDLLQYCLCALQHVVVPEPQDGIAAALQIGASLRILDSTLHVLSPVDLDHELWVQRTEVHHVRPDWLLAAKLDPAELPTAEGPPEATLCVGLLPMQGARRSCRYLRGLCRVSCHRGQGCSKADQ